MEAFLALCLVVLVIGVALRRRARAPQRHTGGTPSATPEKGPDREVLSQVTDRQATDHATAPGLPDATPPSVADPDCPRRGHPPIPIPASRMVKGKCWVIDGDTIRIGTTRMRLA